jgi:RimJ/RimL family protein N-acetyltransferase
MNPSLFQSRLVRLTAEDPAVVAELFARSSRDSEYIRLLDTTESRLWSLKKIKEWLEKDLEKESPTTFNFFIRALEGDRLIGFVGLGGVQGSQGDAWMSIGLGDRQDWGKGYGTDALQVLLRYAFTELNLHRVSLAVFEYNPRALRSYEKAGFRIEGCQRKMTQREGRRWDGILMGILRDEWEKTA